MDRVLVVFPTHWDLRHLGADRRVGLGEVDVVLAEPSDANCPDDFDVLGFIDRTVAGRGFEGVFSSSDYPGATVAAAIATELGLAGSHPDTIMRSSHKFYSRIAQREAAPEATPWFALVDPRAPDGNAPGLAFPCFVKPVKGSFSVLARRIDSREELEEFLARPAVASFMKSYMAIFNRLASRYGRFELDGSWLLAEELLGGQLVTVEGFAGPGGVEILGVVDSILHPETKSFLRFDYPSTLDLAIQRRMEDVARRIAERLDLRCSMFNIEMIYDAAADTLFVIEVNPRMCGQFADLYEKVDGTHGYEIALDLARGRQPVVRRGAGAFGAAASFPLRAFEPVVVRRAPSPAEIAAVESDFPGTYVWSECESGQDLSDFASFEDGHSVRYAVVNTGAEDHAALLARFETIRERLGFELVKSSK